MGLDMYLEEEVFIGAEYAHRDITGTIELYQAGTPIDVPLHLVSSIMLRRGYWRKANAIHSWFVSNVQEGVDECQRSYVSYEQLQQLKSICERIIDAYNLSDGWKDIAADLLGTEGGFFFGSTDYDEYYIEDLKSTIDIINECPKDKSFYYQASW